MAVMRVEKNRNYTVMANYHLRDRRITLKAKGLLSVMLSLPAEWDFTLAGLASINKEGVDAIRTAVNELVSAGYVIRSRRRNQSGQLSDADYTIYEFPQNNDCFVSPGTQANPSLPEDSVPSSSSAASEPVWRKPMLENPMLDSPVQENPTWENPSQINKEKRKKDKENTDISNPHQSNIHLSSPEAAEPGLLTTGKEATFFSPGCCLADHQLDKAGLLSEQKKFLSEPSTIPGLRRKLSLEELECKIKGQIEYWDLIDGHSKDEINNILSIMVEVMSTRCEYFTISGKKYPADLVHQRFSQINFHTIEYVLECMHKCGSDIRNIKQYLIASLFNAPATCDSYYGAAVRRDFEYLRQ